MNLNYDIYNQFEQAKKLIEEARQIVLTTHENTDGDDLGTALAMANFLIDEGKEIRVVIKGGLPANLSFLTKSGLVAGEEANNLEQTDLIIVSGCSNKARINLPNLENLPVKFINFDHHPDNTMYGDVNIVDAGKASVTELAFQFFEFCGWKITSQVAECLLTGIVTDTGALMHSNTTADTLKTAGALIKKGASLSHVINKTFLHMSLDEAKLWVTPIIKAQLNLADRSIISVLTSREMEKFNGRRGSLLEGVVETLNKAPEAKYAMLVKEIDNLTKVSLRSDPFKGVDVKQIAQQFGGGGHKWAAGFKTSGRLEIYDQGWKINSII